ncbi:GH22725 [Drosophila grimshawi]|uniref:GH22725 n=1 Tax=Drosophila grimshawi TaxID=7222 RepID=B4JWJ9_DROGR|nr:GH22725 [Drosophila grimshawi]
MACSKLGKNRVGYQDKVQNLIESMDNLQLNFTDVQHLLCRGFALILIELRLDEASNHFVTALRQVPHCVQALLGLACLAYSRGEYKMALGYFKSVLLHRPQGSMADVRVGIAHCFVQLGDLDRARRAFELALEHNGHSINALIGIAQLKLNQRQPNSTKEGVNLLREAFEQNPHHPLVLTWLSAHCYYEGNYEKLQLLAGNAYRITDDPLIQSQDCFQLARCFHAMKNYDLAFNFYGKSLNEYPHSYAPTEFGIAQIYVRRGDLVRGEELLKSVLNKLPQQPQALRMLATFYSQSGKFEAAVELINIALMHSPTNDYDIWLGLADIYERKQLWQQSLHAYEKAKYIYQGLSESPRDVPLTWRNNIAALQFYANQSKEALQTLNAVMPVTQDEHCESNMLTLKFNRARILEELRQDEQAENIYKQLMREYPNYTDSYLRLGAMAYKRNKIDTALEFFNAVLQRDEHNKAARKLLGICYCKQGSVLHALNHYNAIRRQPQHQHDSEILVSQGNVLLIQAQEDIARGQPEESRRNVENALQLFRKALEQNQCNLWATNGIAVSLTLNGHLADGEKMFELIVNTSNRCTDAILNIAHIALEQQQYAKAIEMYRKYLQEDLLPVNKVQVMQYLARSLYQGGRFEEARDVLIRARHVAPQNRTLLYNLAVAMKQHSQSVFETKLARQELQIAQRLELNRQSELQNRQIDLLNELKGKLNELSEKFNKSISLAPIQYPSSCAEAAAGSRRSNVYQIVVPSYSQYPFIVSCDEKTQGGGWTTVLRRQDGSVDFFLFWENYKKGFGTLTGEFFIGLQKLHFMTKAADQELLITMEDSKGQRRFAMYDRFAIGGEEEAYKLTTLGKYSGDAGDSLQVHVGQKFSTRDRDNDSADKGSCAEWHTGAWWYSACHRRLELNRQSELLNELKGEFKESATKQIRQNDLLNDVINKLNELNQKFAKGTDLESKIDLSRSEQNRQIDLLNELQGEFKESATKQIRQNGWLKVKLNKITSLESKIDELREKFNKSISLQPIQFPSSCGDVQAVNRRSGLRQIVVPGYSLQPTYVSCDEETQGGGWTTVLRRQDGSVDFFRFWEDYKKGFGALTGEFFIGLQKLHFMTKAADQELLITMDFKGQRRLAMYDRFAIGGEEEAYKLTTLGKYSGDAGDSLRSHVGQKFSTRDRDNDSADKGSCAEWHTGAWWYNGCHDSHLMGNYNDNTFGKGVIWATSTGNSSSLNSVQMMIRPKKE